MVAAAPLKAIGILVIDGRNLGFVLLRFLASPQEASALPQDERSSARSRLTELARHLSDATLPIRETARAAIASETEHAKYKTKFHS